MNKFFLGLFIFGIFLFSFNLVSGENIGTFKINQEMQITNYCSTSNCTYANLTTIKYPNGTVEYINSEMTQINSFFNYTYTPSKVGDYYFGTCSDPNGVMVCEEDSFTVTPTGEKDSDGKLYSTIYLLIFLKLLIVGIIIIRRKTDIEKWHKKAIKRYEERNFVKLVLVSIIYNILNNMYVVYYVLGLFIVNLLFDLINIFNIESMFNVMEIVLSIYTWGLILVGIVFFSHFQEWIKMVWDQMEDLKWGIQK